MAAIKIPRRIRELKDWSAISNEQIFLRNGDSVVGINHSAGNVIATEEFVQNSILTQNANLGTAAFKSTLYFANSSQGIKADTAIQSLSNLGTPINLVLTNATGLPQSGVIELSNSLNLKSNINSPSFTGIPLAPTALNNNSSTQLATTNFVHNLIADVVGAAPLTLDTLAELAAQLQADETGVASLTTIVGTKLSKDSNLSDISNINTARTNLGLGSAALSSASSFATAAQGSLASTAIQSLANLGTPTTLVLTNATGLPNASVLGLGTLATQSGTFSGISSGTNTGDQTTITGNAGTATILQTARTINGINFDGSGNIVVAAAGSTLTGTALATNIVSSSLTSAAGGTFGTAAFASSSAYATAAQGTLAGTSVQPSTAPTLTGTNFTNIPESGVTNLVSDLSSKAPLANPTFTGTVGLPAGQVINGITLAGSGTLTTTGGTLGTAAFTAASAFATATQGTKADAAIQSIATAAVLFTNPVSVVNGAATLSLISQAANTVFGNFTGGSATPTFTAATGTGSPVLSTSPTLVTPALGAASATSLSIGGLSRSLLDVTGASPIAYFGNSTTNAGTNTLFFSHAIGTNSQKVAIISQAIGAWGQANLYFAVNSVSDNSNTTVADSRLTILSSGQIQIPGNLAIGTTVAPSDQFEVVGAGVDTYARIFPGNQSNIAGLRFSHNTGTAAQKTAIIVPAMGAYGRGTAFHFVLNSINDVTNATIADSKLTILENGNVGIGTSTPTSHLHITETWNAAGTTFKGILSNITDTASATGSLLMDLQVGGTSKFNVRKDGRIALGNATSLNDGVYITPGAYSLNVNRSHDNATILVSAAVSTDVAGRLGIGDSYLANSPSIFLCWDAANILGQRNGTNAQTSRLYNTYTSITNLEQLEMGFTSNVAHLWTVKGSGGGTARDLILGTDSVAQLTLSATGAVTLAATGTNQALTLTSTKSSGNAFVLQNTVSQYSNLVLQGTDRSGTLSTNSSADGLGLAGNTTLAGTNAKLRFANSNGTLIYGGIMGLAEGILELNGGGSGKLGNLTAGTVTLTALTTPAAPTVTNVGTAGSSSYTYKIVAKQADGSATDASPQTVTATGNATLTGGNYNAISWTAITGATSYDIYRTARTNTSPTTTGKIGNTTGITFNDTGLAGDSATAPTVNNTGKINSSNGSIEIGTSLLKMSSGTSYAGIGAASQYALSFYVNGSSVGQIDNAGQFQANGAIIFNGTQYLKYLDVNTIQLSNAVGNSWFDLKLRSLKATGGVSTGYTSKSAAYTITANDYTIACDATTASFTLTLPVASTCTGSIFVIKKTDSSVNTITITNGTDLIDGSISVIISSQYISYTLQSTGTSYIII